MRPAPEHADEFDVDEDALVDEEIKWSDDEQLEEEEDWRKYAYGTEDGR
jgi:hypothetical protein